MTATSPLTPPPTHDTLNLKSGVKVEDGDPPTHTRNDTLNLKFHGECEGSPQRGTPFSFMPHGTVSECLKVVSPWCVTALMAYVTKEERELDIMRTQIMDVLRRAIEQSRKKRQALDNGEDVVMKRIKA